MAENDKMYILKFAESEEESQTDLSQVLWVGSIIAFVIYFVATVCKLCGGIYSHMSRIALRTLIFYNICLLSNSVIAILSLIDKTHVEKIVKKIISNLF